MWCTLYLTKLCLVYFISDWTVHDVFPLSLNHMNHSLNKLHVMYFLCQWSAWCIPCQQTVSDVFHVSLNCLGCIPSRFVVCSPSYRAVPFVLFRSEFKGKMAQNEFVNAFLQFQALLHVAAGKNFSILPPRQLPVSVLPVTLFLCCLPPISHQASYLCGHFDTHPPSLLNVQPYPRDQ